MGAWGFGPYDNDRAADLVASLMTPVRRVVAAKSDRAASRFYEEARASVHLIVQAHGTDILGGPGLFDGVRVLHRMRLDAEWLATWRSPKRVARTLEDELMELFDVMNHCNRCSVEDVKAVATLIETAQAAKVPRREPRLKIRVRQTRASASKRAWSGVKRAKLHHRKPKR